MYLLWGQALHIGGLKDVFEILIQFCDVGVDGNLCGHKTHKTLQKQNRQ